MEHRYRGRRHHFIIYRHGNLHHLHRRGRQRRHHIQKRSQGHRPHLRVGRPRSGIYGTAAAGERKACVLSAGGRGKEEKRQKCPEDADGLPARFRRKRISAAATAQTGGKRRRDRKPAQDEHQAYGDDGRERRTEQRTDAYLRTERMRMQSV